MKSVLRVTSACLVIILLASFFVACSPSVSDVAGTYTGSYTYKGNDFYVVIVLDEDGTYGKVTSKNNIPSSSDSGEYEIKGNKILLYTSDDKSSYTEYKYSDGKLENNGHTFTKK